MPRQNTNSPIGMPFIITIDVEGDNLWSKPKRVLTRNATYIPRFQDLCEAYGLKPTYLVDYTMAQSPTFMEFGRDIIARGVGEIGMHLHAWETPPIVPLLDDGTRHQPYLTEYPKDIMRAKIHRVTSLLEETFDTPIVSHRGGRFAFDERYAALLSERGFAVDCSVTPHISWAGCPGYAAPGPDYTRFRETPYWLDLNDIQRAGTSSLLEVPVTVFRRWPRKLKPPVWGLKNECAKRAVNRVFPALIMLYPFKLCQFHAAIRSVEKAVSTQGTGRVHLEFMLHSSELMPGGSPSFANEADIDRLYTQIEALFDVVSQQATPMTLAEFHTWYATCESPQED